MPRKEQQNGQTEPSTHQDIDPMLPSPIESEPSTATTSPSTEEADMEAMDILSDLVLEILPERIADQLAAQVWAAIRKKLQNLQPITVQGNSPQFSPSASPDGSRLATSSSAELPPGLPPDANS